MSPLGMADLPGAIAYDPASYWRQRGETYEAKFREEHYRAQEQALVNVLVGFDFGSVLEVGCGFGRIGELVAGLRPDATYTGIDLSPAMLEGARARVPGAELVESSLLDFKPGRDYDLVLAVEVLMHVPPVDIERSVRKLLSLTGRNLVTLDWTTPLPRKKTSAHNFLHDYPALLKATSLPAGGWLTPRAMTVVDVGLQSIHHLVRP